MTPCALCVMMSQTLLFPLEVPMSSFPDRCSLFMGGALRACHAPCLSHCRMGNAGRRWLHFFAVLLLHCVVSSGYRWRKDGRCEQGTDASQLIQFNIAHYNDIHSHLYPADTSMSECNPDKGFGEGINPSSALMLLNFCCNPQRTLCVFPRPKLVYNVAMSLQVTFPQSRLV